MHTTHVNLGENSYDINAGEGILQNAGELIRAVYSGTKIAVLTDSNVNELYGEKLRASLEKAGLAPCFIVMKPGEETKSLENLQKVLSALADNGFTRGDMLAAFGGGVIGDLGGFAAACYMRGIKYVQIPTTLLAQVDSSVGGKTAVNLPEGKNLVGAFWQPKTVIADTLLLNTLDDRQFSSGMAEVIKYGCIFSKGFFDMLTENAGRKNAMRVMPQIISECCNFKRMIVERDEHDTGERMLLNFGHTFGHAVEKLGNYTRYTHGEGVAVGMVTAARYGEKTGVTKKGEAEKIKALCLEFKLPVNDIVSPAAISPLVAIDKKSSGKNIGLILLSEIGKGIICPTALSDFARVMEEGEKEWI
ncbi:MAG: 3-dehydroquinate synthase [Candidatus Avelusimicrobium sp.]